MAKRKTAKKLTASRPNKGDLVRIKQNARSYNGAHIPAYLFVRVFRLGELTGNRAALYFSGMKVVEVNVNDLTVVERAAVSAVTGEAEGENDDRD